MGGGFTINPVYITIAIFDCVQLCSCFNVRFYNADYEVYKTWKNTRKGLV